MCVCKYTTCDAYDKINHFSTKKKNMTLSGADRSDRSHRPIRPVCPRQPARNHNTSNNCITLAPCHLDSINRSITHISTQYKCSQIHTQQIWNLLQFQRYRNTDRSDRSIRPVRPVWQRQTHSELKTLSLFPPFSSASSFSSSSSFNPILLPLCHPSP